LNAPQRTGCDIVERFQIASAAAIAPGDHSCGAILDDDGCPAAFEVPLMNAALPREPGLRLAP
jgi:hypothetical protein